MINTHRAIGSNRSRHVIVELIMSTHLDEKIPSMIELPVEGLIEARVKLVELSSQRVQQ